VPTSYTYEPFGQTTLIGAATANSFEYTGRENDGTGLYYYRARYYHPGSQRFLSQDPIGLTGGPNLYSYVHGNPLRWVDPLGLDLTINEYECCLGFQHIGIGVNERITQGFRPHVENAPIGRAEVGDDSDRHAFTTRTITLRTSPSQDEAVRQFIEKIKRRPGLYVLTGRNCRWFVRSALKEAGIETLNVESPTDVFSDLEARNNVDSSSFYRR
jgi:RHS repeat-associated protein